MREIIPQLVPFPLKTFSKKPSSGVSVSHSLNVKKFN